MPPIEIRLVVSDGGTLSIIDQAGNKLEGLNQSAEKSQGGVSGLGMSLTDLKSGIEMVGGVLSVAGGIVDNIDKIGMASIRAKAGLDAMSGGQTSAYLDGMRGSTKGLVSDLDLAKDATFALSVGVAQSSDDMNKISRDGEVLGEIFSGSAQQGIQDFTRALEMVGQTRPLRALGIDAQAVKKEFEQLKSTMSDQDAWKTAIFDVAGQRVDKLAGAADKATSAMDQLKVKWDNFWATTSEGVAEGINSRIKTLEWLAGQATGSNQSPQEKAVIQETANNQSQQYDFNGTPTGFEPPELPKNTNLTQAKALDDSLNNLLAQVKTEQGKSSPLGNFRTGDLAEQPYAPPPTPDYDKDMRREQAGLRQSYMAGQSDTWRNRTQDLDQFTQAANEAAQTTGADFDLMAAKFNNPDLFAGLDRLQQFENKTQSIEQFASAVKEAANSTSADFNLMAAKFNNPDLFAGLDKLQEAAGKFKTVKDAFHLDSGGIGGEIGGNMGGVEQKARSAFQDQERQKGISGQEYQADLSRYDQSAKEAMDQYAIATGQATEASIAFNDARAKLDSGAASGQITMDQYSQGLLALADAAGHGKTSVEDIAKVMQSIPGADKIQDIAVKYKSMKDAFNLDNGGIGGELTGGLQGAIQQREGHLKGGAKEKFDADAKQAMDDYMIATGQATKESIMFKDQIDSVYAGIASGKVSVKDGTNEILALSNAMSQGATNAADLFRVMGQARDLPGQVRALGGMVQQAFAQGGPGAAAGTGAAGVIDMGLGVVADLAGAGPGKPGAANSQKPFDPYQALKKGVDDYNGSIAATPDIATKAGKATSDALSKTVDVALKVSAGHANDLASGISSITKSLHGLNGTLTTVVTFTASGSGSGSSSGAVDF